MSIISEGVAGTGLQAINSLFVNYYKQIFGQKIDYRMQLNWERLYHIKPWGVEELELPFDEEEVNIFSMGSDIPSS